MLAAPYPFARKTRPAALMIWAAFAEPDISGVGFS
jgi:hypothetical protein